MKRTIALIPLLTLVVLQSGCINFGPKDNVDFGQIESITDLEGVYQNAGEEDNKYADPARPTYLSSIIWPKAKDFNHKAVETIAVRAVGHDTLVVKAIGNGKTIKEGTFVEGKDFILRSGRIQLEWHLLPGHGAGNPLIGIYYEDIDLGLDQRGHGKFRVSGALAGLIYVIPMVLGGYDDVRFVKISD